VATAESGTQKDYGALILRLQAEMDALREEKATADALLPFVLVLSPSDKASGWFTYQVSDADILEAAKSERPILEYIAAQLGLANSYQDLFVPNLGTLDAAAREHGHCGSDNGLLVFAGTYLIYRSSVRIPVSV
jgi:hypothetical protein